MQVQFFFQDTPPTLRNRRKLKSFLEQVFGRFKIKAETLTYIFCTDEHLLEVNRQFLKHDYYTDIITFNLADPGQPVQGEIYISIDRVKENAAALKTRVNNELHRVIFHGVLHLCGLKDKKPTERIKMRKAEDNLLAEYLEK